MPKQRIFVSIDIPEKLKDLLSEKIKRFRETNLARIAKAGNWHITVVFCGDLDKEKIEELKELIKKICNETKEFLLIPDKIIFAPFQRKPRMVWLLFKYSGEFAALSKKLCAFNKDQKPLPHLTLVRFREEHFVNIKKNLPIEGTDLKNEAEPFWVKEINIMESHLLPAGPKYELICRNYLK